MEFSRCTYKKWVREDKDILIKFIRAVNGYNDKVLLVHCNSFHGDAGIEIFNANAERRKTANPGLPNSIYVFCCEFHHYQLENTHKINICAKVEWNEMYLYFVDFGSQLKRPEE